MSPQTTGNEPITALAGLLILSILNTAVLAYMTVRSRWYGWRLILAIGIVLFGVTTLMSQIETAVFVRDLPEGFLTRLVLAGLLFSALFAALLVLILGKRAGTNNIERPRLSLSMSFGAWITKASLIAVIYVAIYFTFGYFVAWKNPVVRAYYGGGNADSFVSQLLHTLQTTPWHFPLQLLRGLLWTLLALPVIRMIRGGRVEAALVVALLFSVVMNTQLLLPNPLMPYEVRITHLLETASSNFIFGWILVWILTNNNAQRTQ